MTRPTSLEIHGSGPSLLAPFANVTPRRWIAALCLFCGLTIMLLCWTSRFSIDPDGISYLDVADQILKGNLSALVHPYWSPGYPCLLALALRVFSPAPSAEILVVHLVTCLMGLMALASFTFFVSQWSRTGALDQKACDPMTDFRLATGFAYTLFLWGTIEMIGFSRTNPDLGVSALVYLAAGLCCRLASPLGGWGTSAWLGIVLSLGYFTKAAMLPLGAVLLVLLAIPRLSILPRRSSLVIATSVFVICIGAYILAMSRNQHRLTFGDSGRLNYAWMVLREIPVHAGWIDYTPVTGSPVHPLKVFMVQPTVIEFKDTVPGTYPLWYDPAFFHEGLRVRFDLRQQVRGLMRSAEDFIVAQHNGLGPLVAGITVLCAFAFRRRFRVDFSRSWLILWALAAFGAFAVVIIEPRYISAFIVLFWIAVYDAVSRGVLASAPSAYRAVIGVAAICILLPQLFHIGSGVVRSIRGTEAPAEVLGESTSARPWDSKAPTQIVVASELARIGLRPGDEIATVGFPFSVYYARLARLRIVANIGFRGDDNVEAYDTDQFWSLSDRKFDSLKEELRRIGAKAIVSPEQCDVASTNRWHSIKDTEYCVYLLN
jgi:hypothetical protein